MFIEEMSEGVSEGWELHAFEQQLRQARTAVRTTRGMTCEQVEDVLEALLAAACMEGVEMELEEVRKVAEVMQEMGVLSAAAVGSVLLKRLYDMPQPIPFIEIFPSLFGMYSPIQLKVVFEELKRVLDSDNQFILPVINALVDLPLTADMKRELVLFTENAITAVDEKDIPFLFRTLLNNLEDGGASRISDKILLELSALSYGTLSLVLEILWEVMPASLAACTTMANHIQRKAINGEKPSLMDVATALILCTTNADYNMNATNSPLSFWIHSSSVFPFHHIETIIRRREDNEVWNRMLSPIYDTCLFLLKFSVSECHILGYGNIWSPSTTQNKDNALLTLQWDKLLTSSSLDRAPSSSFQNFSAVESNFFSEIFSLFSTLFAQAVEYREAIIQALICNCFNIATEQYCSDIRSESSTSIRDSQLQVLQKIENRIRYERDLKKKSCPKDDKDARFRGRDLLPLLKDCLMTTTCQSTTRYNSSVRQHGIAHISACILEQLVAKYPETHSVVLTSLVDKINANASFKSQWMTFSAQTPYASTKAYDATLLLFPSSLILHRLISSVAQASQTTESSENSILIFIQKIIGVHSPPDPHVELVLCSFGGRASSSPEKNCARNHSHVENDKVEKTSKRKRKSDNIAGTQSREFPPCAAVYHYPRNCIGVLLASYMLLHYLIVQDKHLSDHVFVLQDVTALLKWLDKLLSQSKDLSVAYTLDVLSVVAGSMTRRNFEDTVRANVVPLLSSCLHTFENTYGLRSFRIKRLEKCEKRHVILSTSGVVDFSRVKIWQVAKVARNMVTIASEQTTNMQHGQQPLKSLSNFSASLCWIFQKVSILDENVSIMSNVVKRNDVKSCSLDELLLPSVVNQSEESKNSNENMFVAMSLTACNSDLNLMTMLASSESEYTDCVSTVQYWLCKSFKEYARMEQCHLPVVKNLDDVIQNLQMAWESALAGAVFSGKLQTLCQLSFESITVAPSQDQLTTVVTALYHTLGSFVRTRYFLRLADPFIIAMSDKSHINSKRKESPLIRNTRGNGIEVGGDGDKKGSINLLKKKIVDADKSHMKERNEGLFIQNYFIRRCIDRMSLQIPIMSLIYALGIKNQTMIVLENDKSIVREWVSHSSIAQQLSTEDTFVRSSIEKPVQQVLSASFPMLFTDSGLQMTLVICGKYLSMESVIPSHLKKLMVDPFLTLDEINMNKFRLNQVLQDSGGSSSSTEIPRYLFDKEEQCQISDGTNEKSTIIHSLCQLFSYLPVLIRRAHILRLIEASTVHSPPQEALCDPFTGGLLDEAGHSLILSFLYMGISAYFREISSESQQEQFPSSKCQKDTMSSLQILCGEQNVREMLNVVCVFALEVQREFSDDLPYMNEHEENNIRNSCGFIEKLVLLYRIIERNALGSPNLTVAIASLKCLENFGVSDNALLQCRMQAVIWASLKSIHHYSEPSIFPQEESLSTTTKQSGADNSNGVGLILPYFCDFIHSSLDLEPSRTQKVSISPDFALWKLVSAQCRKMKQALHIAAKKLVVKNSSGMHQAAEKESFEGFACVFSMWWCSNLNSDNSSEMFNDTNRKLHGLFLLFLEVFMQCDVDHVRNEMKFSSCSKNSEYVDEKVNASLSSSLKLASQDVNLHIDLKSHAEHIPDEVHGAINRGKSSRARKAVSRFEPENYLKRSGEVLHDAYGDEKNTNSPRKGMKKIRSDRQPSPQVNLIMDTTHVMPVVPVAQKSRLKRSDVVLINARNIKKNSNNDVHQFIHRFKRITECNFEAYHLFLLSYLPSLILSSEPYIPPDTTSLTCDISLGPYQPYINVLQLSSWCIDEACELICPEGICESGAKQTIPSWTSHVIRMCRTAIGAMEHSILLTLHWRNSNTCQELDINGLMTDWASVDYVGYVFAWSIYFLQRINIFAARLLNRIISSETISFPKGLSRSVPALKNNVDKLLVKLERWKLEFESVELNVNNLLEQIISEESWLNNLFENACIFDEKLYEMVNTPLSFSSFEIGTAERHTTQKPQVSSDPNLDLKSKSLNMIQVSNGFGVSSDRQAASSGWGWDSDSDSDSDCSGESRDDYVKDISNGIRNETSPLAKNQGQSKVSHHVDATDYDDENDDVEINSVDSFDTQSESDDDF